MSDDDPILFCEGSRLAVHLARLPSISAWRNEAARVGVSLEMEAALEAGLHSITARDRVSHVTLDLEISPCRSEDVELEADSEAERAVCRRTRWAVHIRPSRQTPDRLPTALAVSLAAAGAGVCCHSALDRAVFGGDTPAMMAELCAYAEQIDDPGSVRT